MSFGTKFACLYDSFPLNSTSLHIALLFPWSQISRGEIKIFKALARLASNSKFLLAKSEKNRQNHVFAEHLYSVHFVCTRPIRKVDHHDCVCVKIINKSPCQMCVCISESGRNKTQLVGKKDSLRGGKKHSPNWRVS
jgi:hypothetical protein